MAIPSAEPHRNSRGEWPRSHPWIDTAFALAVTLVLVVFVALCAFARPSLDDYVIACRVREHGLVGAQVFWYEQWTGKYFGMMCMSLFAGAVDLDRSYWLAPSIVLLAVFSVLLAVARTISPKSSWRVALVVSALLTAIFLAGVPAPRESIYWLTGAYAYLIGGVTLAALLALLLAKPVSRTGRTANAAASAIAAFCAVGSCETLMFPLLALAMGWIVAVISGRAGWSPRGIAVVIAIAVGAAMMVLAPGNSIRSGHFVATSHDLGHALLRSIERDLRSIVTWSSSLTLLGAGLMFSRSAGDFGRRLGLSPGWRTSVGLVALLATAFFPAYWAMGSKPPPRAMAAIWVLFVLGWFAVLVPSAARWMVASGWHWSAERRLLAGKLLIAIGLYSQANVMPALGDLIGGDATAFRRESAARDEAAAEARANGEDSVVLPPLQARPAMLFIDDLGEDPSDWRNRAFAEYHGLVGATMRRE